MSIDLAAIDAIDVHTQGFFPNDRIACDLCAVIEEAGPPALFHTGHSGMGSGLPGGGGIRLK